MGSSYLLSFISADLFFLSFFFFRIWVVDGIYDDNLSISFFLKRKKKTSLRFIFSLFHFIPFFNYYFFAIVSYFYLFLTSIYLGHNLGIWEFKGSCNVLKGFFNILLFTWRGVFFFCHHNVMYHWSFLFIYLCWRFFFFFLSFFFW